MRVFPVLYLPEPGAGLQLAGAGSTERQSLASKVNYSGGRIGIKTGYTGISEIWLGIREGGFREDRI